MEYAFYRGEEILAVGSLDYISKKLNINRNTLKFYKSSAYRKRCKSINHKILIRLEEDYEMNFYARKIQYKFHENNIDSEGLATKIMSNVKVSEFIDRVTILNVCHGKVVPNFIQAMIIANALGSSVSMFYSSNGTL